MNSIYSIASDRGGVPQLEVRAQLDRIVGSDAFARAPQLRRFLVYIVEEALAGRGSRLKEYTLGVDVFDRGAAFDPRADPIVRVDARRLRQRLVSYYAAEGAGDAVEIALARGSYLPIFRRRAGTGPATARTEPVRLMVLPLRDAGAVADGFAESLGDELQLALARRPELRVLGPASARRLRDRPDDLQALARELDAALILDGTVHRAGAQLRIVVMLGAVADGAQVWSERYDATLADPAELFALQDRIALQIVEQVAAQVHEVAAARRLPTGDVAAYELYLRARHLINLRNPGVLGQAMAFLADAVERDPGFGLAQAALAEAHFASAIFLLAPPRQAMQQALAQVEAALASDPGLAAAHSRRATLSVVLDHDFGAAADGFARALSRNPRDLETRYDRAMWLLAPLGRLDEAAAEMADLLASDPYSLRLRVDHARILLFQRRWAEAIAQLTMVLDMEPQHGPAAFFLACAHGHAGDLAAARAAHERHVRQFPYPLVTDWLTAATAVWEGDSARASAIVAGMEASATQGPAAATVLADIHLRLGQPARALDWLEKAADKRIYRIAYLAVDPDYAPLHSLPRFQALVRRVGLAADKKKAPRRAPSSSMG